MTELFPWQQPIWNQLTRRSQPAHAYLLHGPAGSGKRQMAELLAHWLLCRQPQPEGACGQCSSCLLLAAGSHPDMLRLQPEEPGKGILIAAVRELVGKIQQTAQQGGRQVVLLEPAEAMTLESANALLKSLEEPTSSTVFLLITDQLGFLLPTIKSRCVLQACPLPDWVQAQAWLAVQLPDLEQTQRDLLLQLAAGSPLKALEFADDGVLKMRADVVEGVKQLIKRQQSPAQLAGQWSALPAVLLLEWFAQWCQDIMRFQLTGNESDLGLEDMQAVLGYVARYAQPETLLQIREWALQRRHKLLRRSPIRGDLLLESLLVRWLELLKR